MLDFIRRHNVHDSTVRLLPFIILLSVFIPVLLYLNAKSITLYLTTIKLHDTFETVISDTSELLHGLQTKEFLLRNSSNLHRHKLISQPTTAEIKSKLKRTSETTPTTFGEKIPTTNTSEKIPTTPRPTARPQSCDGCLSVQFEFLINNENICEPANESVDILILITSAPQNNLARKAIRETWLKYTRQNKGVIRYAFLLGKSPEDQEIKKENSQTKDIILGNFHDAYSNLTYKTLMGLQWALTFCNQTKFVMKTDDDMYVNIPGLMKKVADNRDTLQTAVGGYCYHTGKPIRNKKSKWYASLRSYPQKTYPGFCSGTGYVTSINVVSKIVTISKDIPFFHLEDVYVSLCINKIGYRLQNLKGFMTKSALDPCRYKDISLVTVHQVPIKSIKYIWKKPCLFDKNNDTQSVLTEIL